MTQMNRMSGLGSIVSFLTILASLALFFGSAPAAAQTCGKLFAGAGRLQPIGDLRSEYVSLSGLAISNGIQIVGQRNYFDAAGIEVGSALVMRPVDPNVDPMKHGRNGLEPYRTEIDDQNRSLFEALGFKERIHDVYGRYMAEVPNAKLYEYLRAQYNSTVPPQIRINMGIYQSNVVSAHQSEILKFWIDEATIAIGRPELGSVLGKTPAEIASLAMVNGQELNSIYRHDLEHFASIQLVVGDVVEFNRHVSRFWQKVVQRAHAEVRAGRIQANGPEFRSVMDVTYIFVRRFHSLMHVLGMLVRANGVIDINQHLVNDFGDVARRETPAVHWVGLGFRPAQISEKDMPFESRLLKLGLIESQTVDHAIQITDAYAAVTNGALAQARAFIDATADPTLKAVYLQMLHETQVDAMRPMTAEHLKELQDLTLYRYRAMGDPRVSRAVQQRTQSERH